MFTYLLIMELFFRAGQVRYTESSMSNGFGLKYVHKFFGLPFLHLQRESLKNQLEKNSTETELTLNELDLCQSDYDELVCTLF